MKLSEEELKKAKQKLEFVQGQLTAAEKVCAELADQIAPLRERLDKLKKDAEYYRSRVLKYQAIIQGGKNG